MPRGGGEAALVDPTHEGEEAMEYRHTQTGGLHHVVVLVGAMTLLIAWFLRGAAPILPVMLTLIAAMTFAIAFSFKRLTVEDEGDRLAIRFGPLPLFSKTVRYSDITGVEPGRTSLIDGWGIHYIPGRGSTWNLWGFGCVKLTLGRRVLRIGTDDVENLAGFLRGKIS